tara:strand:- start:927 stop:1229 length:303 start_codon:yes stop_codon:yes gene_type:complete
MAAFTGRPLFLFFLCPSTLGLGIRSFEYSVSPVVIFISETSHSKQPMGRLSCYFCCRELPLQMEVIFIVICVKCLACYFYCLLRFMILLKQVLCQLFKVI